MLHPFHKVGHNTSGLPGRVSSTMWSKLKKYAHDVWDINDDGSGPRGVRKRQETAQIEYDAPNTSIDSGDVILLFLGGKEVEARVLTQWDDGTYSVVSDYGYIDNIHPSWVEKKAQAAPVQTPPNPRRDTREDVPAQSNKTVDYLQHLLQVRGGHIAVEISPSSILEIKLLGENKIDAKLWHISTQMAHQGYYQSLLQLVQNLSLNGVYQERPTDSLAPINS